MTAPRRALRQPVLTVKIGGSIITDRGTYCTVDQAALESCAHAIACWVRKRQMPLIIVLGGGSFGHNVVDRHGLAMDGCHSRQCEAFELTAALFELKVAFSRQLARRRVASMALQESSVFRIRGSAVTAPGLWAVDACLRGGYVPILTGGLIARRTRQFCPVSSDRVFLPLCHRLPIRRVAMFTDQTGVLRRGRVVRLITRANRRLILPHLEESTRLDVTGGMRGKVEAALDLARHGVETVITDGRHLDVATLAAAFSARPAGTLVAAWK
jgi:isopentenyl phosphate kinase